MNTLTSPHLTGTRPQPRMVEERGIRLGLAHVVLVVVSLAATTLGLGDGTAFALLAGVAIGGGSQLPRSWAAGLGASAWAFYTGFFEHGLGQLTLAPVDVLRLAVMICVATTGSTITARGARRG